MDIEAFHSFDIDGADPHRQARFHFLERNSGTRIANAWLGPSGPGSLPGSLVLSNADFQAGLARWTVFCEESLKACELCGLPVTQHDHRCYLHTSTPRHDAVADALRLVLDPAYAGHGAVNPPEREPVVGNKNGHVARADLKFPGGVLPGLAGTQVLDFVFTRATRLRPARRLGETAYQWTERTIHQQLRIAHKKKLNHYRHVIHTEPQLPITPIAITTQGAGHDTVRRWLAEFPIDIRLAVRRCISFTLLVYGNRSVTSGLIQSYQSYHCETCPYHTARRDFMATHAPAA